MLTPCSPRIVPTFPMTPGHVDVGEEHHVLGRRRLDVEVVDLHHALVVALADEGAAHGHRALVGLGAQRDQVHVVLRDGRTHLAHGRSRAPSAASARSRTKRARAPSRRRMPFEDGEREHAGVGLGDAPEVRRTRSARTPLSARPASSAPRLSARGRNGRTTSVTSAPAETFTAYGTNSPLSASRTISATGVPALSCASTVEAPGAASPPRCRSANSGESRWWARARTRRGPRRRGVRPRAPSRAPPRRRCPPREVLTSRAPCFISDSSCSPISPSVSGVRGRWIETKSACTRSASSVGIASTPISFARSRAHVGIVARSRASRTPRRAARRARPRARARPPRSSCPRAPRPATSTRSHDPASRRRRACGMLRACASISAIACSAALMMLDCGAFTTITPRRVAASTSTLSRPMPARATTFRLVGRLEHCGRYLRGAADDERVVGRDLGREVPGGELGAHVHLEVLPQQIEARVGELLGDQDPHGQRASRKTDSAAADAAPRFTGMPEHAPASSPARRDRG